jgi:hypothetical protein
VGEHIVAPLLWPLLASLMIRFVTFDALYTLITPRKPIYVQYSEAFSPYLGPLPPDVIARSFKLGVLSFCDFYIASARFRQPGISTSAVAVRKTSIPWGLNEVLG